MDFERVKNVLAAAGQPSFRLKQVRQAFFVQLVGSWGEASALPADLRDLLTREVPLSSLAPVREVASQDGRTVKAVLSTGDGQVIETVLMRHEGGRRTVCVSSQVGCPMRCAFCATGRLGLARNLTAEEIVDQVMHFARRLKAEGSPAVAGSDAAKHQLAEKISRDDAAPAGTNVAKAGRLTNVVVMGMGEPMHNLDAVLAAIRELNSPDGLGLGARHFSISTCGIIPGIERLAEEPLQINLAISLHAANQELRERLMPVAGAYPLDKLMAACRAYADKTNRKVMFEYLLLDGVNDSEEDADRLADLMGNGLFHVNLIKYHATGAFRATPRERREQFQAALERRGIPVTFRVSFGEDIAAACGQLAGRGRKTQAASKSVDSGLACPPSCPPSCPP